MLDTLDDVFWMLPFSSKKQAQIIRQENNISDEEWQKRRDLIMAEHRLPTAKDQLVQQWKVWIAQDAFKARREAATRAQAAAEIPEYDE
jgi:methionine salvage enolase-phosphatase E1